MHIFIHPMLSTNFSMTGTVLGNRDYLEGFHFWVRREIQMNVQLQFRTLTVCYLMCGSQTSSISFTGDLVRNGKSSAPPQTYWIRIWILTRSPSDLCAHYKFEKLSIPILSCLPWQVTGLIIFKSSLPF